jgi:hypothetical protein
MQLGFRPSALHDRDHHDVVLEQVIGVPLTGLFANFRKPLQSCRRR